MTSSESIARQKEQATPYGASLAIVVNANGCALAHPSSIQDPAFATLHVIVHYFATVTTPGKLIQAACAIGKSHAITC